ncbi:metal-dependent transcriptional regulator [Microbacterium sp. VKM Ac-2923]|uniref:metal-dependent transcriptional regulator n=1 Tax=Microbacterium sp. VKM Ac-2923 TaxID=2929476 RepID=UPI001FB3ABCD|nr:metal-dependent transcriptional regulator [Microbacterium sp. VKM Ac-2923]MCJ1708508.1 metal-dependent transcriptional regulator [Microbacterium sp. VKM Ac-2923]
MTDLINVTEMYLKAVLEIHETRMPKRRVHIAHRLEQSGPTVTKTVSRMQRDDLLSFSEESKVIDFTDRGFRLATDVMRKHRLAEGFLHDVIGLDLDLVHEEACRWEHVMSDDVADRIDDLLHRPLHSPYGNPIPGKEAARWDPLGDEPDVKNLVRLLVETGAEQHVTIAWIGEPAQAQPLVLTQLRSVGALPGARVRCALHGSAVMVHAQHGTEVIELQLDSAAQLFVRA